MSDPRTAETVPATGSVLVVDDEFSVRDSLEGWFRKDGYLVASAADSMEALRKLQERTWDVVLLDIRMPGMDGIELQHRIHELDPELIVIMITAFASVETAVKALKEGAFDYVTKPIDPDELSRLVRRGIQQRRSRAAANTEQPADDADPFVAGTPAMQGALELARSAAATDVPVTIRGESGTGRELLAQYVHDLSQRRNFPFVPVRCAALDDAVLESELFGHDKMAVAGARYRRKGRLEMAEGGTLLLKEIETVSPRMQAELLRALETREFRRVGNSSPVEFDVRIMAATDQDLERLVAEGRFREDLFFRLNVLSITIPPLRARKSDVPALARRILRRAAERSDRPFRDFDDAAMAALESRRWPGNVRELVQVVEHAVVVGRPPLVRLQDLPPGD